MAQDIILGAFRKRLKNRGYLNIHIYKTRNDIEYFVSFVEPIFHRHLEGIMTFRQIYNAAR